MTTVYLLRHSEPLKVNNIENSDSLQLQNEKWGLTINGENIAKEKSKNSELQDFDIVFSSNYVRAIATAKYFTNDKINVVESFGERKFGIDNWNELPDDFSKKQYEDFDYKFSNGESLNMVINREYEALNNILNNYKDKKMLIVGHSTAIASLLTKWCDVDFMGDYKFNNEVFFDGKWNYCECFRLEFDDNNKIISIDNIKFD